MTLSLGCASSRPTEIIHQDERGTVFLETIPDPAFEATHPISLDAITLRKVLRGIYVRDEQRFLQQLMAGKAVPVRVLSDDQAEFLAPLLTQALTRATARQLVRFRVIDLSGSPPGTTGGTLSAYGLSLYISLTQYRPAAAPPPPRAKPGHQTADPSGLKDRTVLFFPTEALRTGLAEPQAIERGGRTLVVDYGLLAGLRPTPVTIPPRTPPAPTRAQPPGSGTDPGHTAPLPPSASGDLKGVQDRLRMQDREIQALREKVQYPDNLHLKDL